MKIFTYTQDDRDSWFNFKLEPEKLYDARKVVLMLKTCRIKVQNLD